MSKETLYWTTKDGRRLNVDDMDDNHVRNAFKMLLRRLISLKLSIPHNIEDIPQLHGDMANEFNDSFLGDEWDDCDATIVDIEP